MAEPSVVAAVPDAQLLRRSHATDRLRGRLDLGLNLAIDPALDFGLPCRRNCVNRRSGAILEDACTRSLPKMQPSELGRRRRRHRQVVSVHREPERHPPRVEAALHRSVRGN